MMIFILSLSVAFAAPSNSRSKGLIQKAQELVLKQDRESAQNLLLSAIQSERDIKTRDGMLKALGNINEIFLTDKTQKIFEQGFSILRGNTNEALRFLNQALEAEKTNTKILLNIGRAHLLLGQCPEAIGVAQQLEQLNPYQDRYFLLKIQALTCTQEIDGLVEKIEKRLGKSVDTGLFANMAIVQIYYLGANYVEALKYLQKAKKINSNFPEIYYWENQLKEKMGEDALPSATNYVKLCKGFSKNDYLKFDLEPRVCQEYKSLEQKIAELKSDKKED